MRIALQCQQGGLGVGGYMGDSVWVPSMHHETDISMEGPRILAATLGQ